MKSIVVSGKNPLHGTVKVGGSKNSALPILFATLITRGESRINNFPRIGDTEVALSILTELGAEIYFDGDAVIINTENLYYREPSEEHVCKIRASTYLIGSMLSRFGKCRLSAFGGCNFAKRPIDIHLDVCRAMGARKSDNMLFADEIRGAKVNLRLPSVGATVNALIMASVADGVSNIRGYAKEPHILKLIDFLRSAGAKIDVMDTEILVEGRELHGGNVTIDGDTIEAVTYLAAGVVTDGRVGVWGFDDTAIDSPLRVMRSLGLSVYLKEGCLFAERGEFSYYAEITATPYPGFPTDLQPIFAPMLSSLSGGKIIDTVWRERFGYLDSLVAFGIKSAHITDGALIYKSRLHSGEATSPDLRGGMACLLSALAASGESIIYCAEALLRGYENLENKLCSLGASVKIKN